MQSTRLVSYRSSTFLGRDRAGIVALAVVLGSFASTAIGQAEYATLPIDDKARNDRNAALNCLKNPGAFSAEKPRFDNYFQNYYFPAMTRTDPEGLAALGKMREDLFKRMLWTATNKQAHDDLTMLAFKAMGQIVGAQGPAFHPAVRYNAILIIGLLDQKYSDRQPPEPLAAARKPLTAVVDMATTSTRFPPSVILGAVIGLDRHAQYRQSMSPGDASAMSAALVKLVAHKDPIQDMDREAYTWLRLRAAGVLARLGSVGEKNAVHDAIVNLAANGRSIDDRCAAAGLLAQLEYKDVKLEDAGTAEPLFALARDLAAAEDKKALEFQDQFSTGGGFASGGFVGGFNPDGTPMAETFPRRQVLSRLMDLRSGLRKVKPALSEEAQTKADAVITALSTVITATSNKSTVELTLVDELRKMARAINAALPPAEKAPPEKVDEGALFGEGKAEAKPEAKPEAKTE